MSGRGSSPRDPVVVSLPGFCAGRTVPTTVTVDTDATGKLVDWLAGAG
ncbi:MAG TPA: hypothetical protein VFW64_19915 [Pseudonocardiaceae bacterium]|nr:hypothetical protein [Pseudonocardiaceae bacterium]